jgi:hypothetical protein
LYAGDAGIFLFAGGSVRNTASASIVGFYRGVEIDGNGTVLNYGSITSTARSSEAVFLSGGGTVINEAGASLTGSFTVGLGDAGDATLVNRGNITGSYVGVTLSDRYGPGESVSNAASGRITGPVGVGIIDGGKLTNAGLIVGTSGTAVNCYGTGGSNLIVLDPGFGFTGLVLGNSSASNTLELASATSAGTVTGVGAQFLHFDAIVFDPGARWTVAGVPRGLASKITGFAAGDTIDITGGGIVPATVSGPGKLQLDDGTFHDTAAQISGGGTVAGVGSVVVDAGAVLELTGGGALPMNIAGDGTLDLVGTTPYTFVNGQALGTAQVEIAAGATLSGTGTVGLEAAAELILNPGFTVLGTVKGGANSAIAFAAGAGPASLDGLGTTFTNFRTLLFEPGAQWTVPLATPTTFAGTFSGFTQGDVIDLLHVAATSAVFSGGVLRVANGATTVATLHFAGPYIASEFFVRSDGRGGTDITDRPPPSGLTYRVAADKGSAGDTFTVGGKGVTGDTVTLFDRATAIGTAKVAAGGTWSITPAGPLGVGAHSLSAREVDAAGNKSPGSPVQSITVESGAPNAVVFVGTPGIDNFTGGAGGDVFRFSRANLANTDIVRGGGGIDELFMTSAGPIQAQGVSAVETYRLANGAGNTLSLSDANFAGVIGASITIDGGNAGNTIDGHALTGAHRITAVGGAGKEVLTGGAGNDIFQFSAANLAKTDLVNGGGGNDSLMLTSPGTIRVDGVKGVETYLLKGGGNNSLTLGTANFVGVAGKTITVVGGDKGNALSEAKVAAADRAVIKGGAGADTLVAGQNAALTGGLGVDTFELTTPGSKTTPDTNTVTDFAHGTDKIAFSKSGFSLGPSPVATVLFTANPTGGFTAPAQRFAYDTKTGQLFYDAHGSASPSSRLLVATLTSHPTPNLTAADIRFFS